jgi:hypothetical protein
LFLLRHPKSPLVLVNVLDPGQYKYLMRRPFISLQAPHGWMARRVHTARNCVAGPQGALGTPPRFIYRANSLDKVHARL